MVGVWVIVLVVSLAVLVKAADWFTEGAEELGVYLGVPPYVVGLTIVSMGTSLPELISSVVAVARGSPEIVAGNVIGSNITNICLVLALGAIVGGHLLVGREIVRIDLPILASSTALLALTALDGTISRGDGAILFLGAAIYGFYGLRISRPALVTQVKVEAVVEEELKPERERLRKMVLLKLAGGAILLYFAAEYTVESVVELSILLDIGADLIAISAVALGTSLPELAVSVMAARRGKLEVAMANVLGSNIFNALAVVGIPALIAPLPVTSTIRMIGLPFLAVATVLYFFMAQDREITRWEAMPLVLLYLLFIGMLFGLF